MPGPNLELEANDLIINVFTISEISITDKVKVEIYTTCILSNGYLSTKSAD